MKLIFIILFFISNITLADTWQTAQKLTSVGPERDNNFDVNESAIAINSNDNSYMIVWEGNDSRNDTALDEDEIFGQIHTSDGTLVNSIPIRMSFMGPNFSLDYDARKPEIVYNPDENEYLVVWYGDHNENGLIEGEFEIFAQRIDASNGQLISSMQRVSDMGPISNRSYDALNPHVSYNSVEQKYLVIWHGEDGNSSSPLGSFEIYGQFLDKNANEIGENDFRISDMGPDNNPDYNAFSPVASYNSTNNEFLIVWYGEDERDGRLPGEFEIYAQRINAINGELIGDDSTSVSFVGANGDIARAAKFPDVSYNNILNQYLIVWSADDSKNGNVGNEFEIYGQIMDSNLQEIGKNDFLISEMGPIGLNNFDAFRPKVAFQEFSEQYIVVWRGDDSIDGEFEIYTQRLDANNQVRIGKSSERLSHAGPDNSLTYDARRVDIAINNSQVVVIWEQEDESDNQVAGEFEVFITSLQSSSFTINETMTGSWFNQTRDGEGYIIEMLSDNLVLMTWFTYLPDQTEQAWIIGVGSVKNNRIILNSLQITSGGIFGPSFDPNAIVRMPWGEMSFEFEDCNTATVSYKSSLLTYGYGDHFISKLTSLSGLICGEQDQNNDKYNGLSGAWFDPTHDGEGWILEYLGNNTFVIYWFSYDNVGQQKWFFGVGTINEQGVIDFNDVKTTEGTSFGVQFNANDVIKQAWGSIELIVNNCNSITVNYESSISNYNQGQLDSVKLTSIDNMECNL